MSVVIETTVGDITVDLFMSERPRACLNFLKLCKLKYYNYNLFHTISRGFVAQTGDPTGSRSGGESIYGILDSPSKRFFEGENEPRIKHTKMGLLSFVGNEERMIGSQFFFTLGEDLTYLDEKHCVFGEVVEGFDVLEMINEAICDRDDRPYQDVRVTHTVILDDPYPDPKRLIVPSRSPSPSAERLQGGRIAPDEEVDDLEGKTTEEVIEMQAEREAKARATILEMVGDLPDADMAPPENVLFVCKLNPVTDDDDLEIIFSRFGKIKSCEVIRDKKTGDSLQYAFVEFENQKACEDAYFKMDNVLIDDRRIHVDFSQSVSKIKWLGKGRGVRHYDDKGRKNKQEHNRENDKHGKNRYYDEKSNSKKSSRIVEDRVSLEKNNRDNSYKGQNFTNDEKSKSKKYTNRREQSLSPKRKRYSESPKRSETRHSSNYEYEREYNRSTKNKNKSPSPRRYRDSSSSSKRDYNDSKPSYNRGRYRDKSKSPRGNNYRNSRDNKNPRSSEKMYSKERASGDKRNRTVDVRTELKERKRSSYSSSEDESKRNKKLKKSKYYSQSSDSDTHKKKKKKKAVSSSSDSSDSDYKSKNIKRDRDRDSKKKSKKKKSKKTKYSDTDSD